MMTETVENEAPATPRSSSRCWLCGSHDTMVPFRRAEALPLLSALLPLRWRYCRRGAHHFIELKRPRRR